MKSVFWTLLFYSGLTIASQSEHPPRYEHSPPRIQALLEEAWAFEERARVPEEELFAAAIYCEAARFGSAEGHYRAGLIFLRGTAGTRDPVSAKAFFYYAQELGHPEVGPLLKELGNIPIKQPACLSEPEAYRSLAALDFSRHLAQLPESRRKIASMITQLAPHYGVPPGLALAVAAVESNFNATAQSSRNARGIMQLIPATAERFGVRNVWNPEENIRGGLSYLKFLLNRFQGKQDLAVAAYNAGEGSVDKYGGIPPYYETQSYVFRVLSHARKLALSKDGDGR